MTRNDPRQDLRDRSRPHRNARFRQGLMLHRLRRIVTYDDLPSATDRFCDVVTDAMAEY